ncbi:hypothetical protein [Kitasatospora mediocidica]|uniref:hypothetical protein n=1 Tax=Kitasatospora mediocidica TaxID=58352 RepID=UPI0006903CA8|nr:hypothetical protein [Kitasatospora mediocidica]
MTTFLAFAVVAFVSAMIRAFRASRSGQAKAARPKMPKGFDPLAHGLVPRAQLDPDRAGPPLPAHHHKELHAIAHAAWAGDWRSAAAHVEAAQGWDERWARTEFLLQVASSGDGWLTDWRNAEPDDCTAATLHARLLVHQAWEIRGNGYAKQVPPERMARFLELLPASMEAAKRAALLDPRDPGPWVVMVTTARALQYGHEQFRPLWDGLVERAPHHYDGHWQTLQYWCAKWSGSDKQMVDFAERAARTAPAGSPLAGMYLHALHELEKRHGAAALPSSGRAKERLGLVVESLALVPESDEHLPYLRHLAAHYLGRAGLHDAALEQFRLIGPWCGAYPWNADKDPVAAFDLARALAATGAGTRQPAGKQIGKQIGKRVGK